MRCRHLLEFLTILEPLTFAALRKTAPVRAVRKQRAAPELPVCYCCACRAASSITAATFWGCDSYTEWLAPGMTVVWLRARA